MQKDSTRAKISSKVVGGGYFFDSPCTVAQGSHILLFGWGLISAGARELEAPRRPQRGPSSGVPERPLNRPLHSPLRDLRVVFGGRPQ